MKRRPFLTSGEMFSKKKKTPSQSEIRKSTSSSSVVEEEEEETPSATASSSASSSPSSPAASSSSSAAPVVPTGKPNSLQEMKAYMKEKHPPEPLNQNQLRKDGLGDLWMYVLSIISISLSLSLSFSHHFFHFLSFFFHFLSFFFHFSFSLSSDFGIGISFEFLMRCQRVTCRRYAL